MTLILDILCHYAMYVYNVYMLQDRNKYDINTFKVNNHKHRYILVGHICPLPDV